MNTLNPEKIKNEINKNAVFYYSDMDGVVTAKKRGVVIGWLNRVFGSDQIRRVVLGWLFLYQKRFSRVVEPMSSKSLNDGQWMALIKWINSHKDMDANAWTAEESFFNGAAVVMQKALEDFVLMGRNETELDLAVAEGTLPSSIIESILLGGKVSVIADEKETEKVPTERHVKTIVF